jgi:calpain-15
MRMVLRWLRPGAAVVATVFFALHCHADSQSAAIGGIVHDAFLASSSAFATAATESSESDEGFLGIGFALWIPIIIAACYAVVYGIGFAVFKHGTERRADLNYFMCCWGGLYRGNAWKPYVVLFSPILLIFHALRIFPGKCVHIYAVRLKFLLFGKCMKYYTDPDFPPTQASLGDVSGDSANATGGKSDADVIWVRASDFLREDVNDKPNRPTLHSSSMQLFLGKIEAADVLQGQLGDCWLLAAMAALADHPTELLNRVFLTPELNPAGKYVLRLFDPQEQIWKKITVDDYVPCERDDYAKDKVARLAANHNVVSLYASPNGKEIWAMILEKAFAKMCGGYAAIEGGITEWAIMAVTGCAGWRYISDTSGDKPSWQRLDLKPDKGESGKREIITLQTEEKHDSDRFFKVIMHYHRNGAVLCCGGVQPEGESLGLVRGHAFSILKVRQVAKEGGHSGKFIQMRNPWGTGEWSGPWSDSSDLWNTHPKVKAGLGYKNKDDGKYWMEWCDFVRYWGYIGCVDVTTDIANYSAEISDDTLKLGPLTACCKGCFHYWFCSGCLRLLVSHKASKRKLVKDEYESKCGVDLEGCYCRLCDKS